MVESSLVIVIHPRQDATLVLGLKGHDEILRASLGPPSQAHHQAAPMLLEALALWYQQPLRVVLSVDNDQTSACMGISDGFGFGQRTLHYSVEVRERERPPRGRRLGGVADFCSLRRQVTGRSR
jgi:hypothetical protein